MNPTDPSPEAAPRRIDATVTLNQGSRMPWLGLGVWQMHSEAETERTVCTAIEHGYRSIDTARIYGNERGVGEAVRHCGIPRDQLFITTKVWTDDIRSARVAAAFEESLERLALDYVDLYLVHWPIRGKIVSTWHAMEALVDDGRVRAIGVSNHLRPHLDELLPHAKIVPAVNQIEFHPYLQSRPLVEFCRDRGIRVEAWSPLMKGGALLEDPVLQAIAKKHRKTVAQVVLRWDLQCGVVTIPKSVRRERIAENAGLFDFTLEAGELQAMGALERNQRSGADPLNFPF
jgi:methylglyoxal/glyoxal reductase